MAERCSGTAVVVEKLREFDRIATLLDMPRAERLNILNVAEDVYAALSSGNYIDNQDVRPQLERRLSYALPLMRRLAGNSPILRSSSTSAPFGMHAA